MFRELMMSVASGVVVALVLGIFRGMFGGGRRSQPVQAQNYYAAAPAPRRRRSFLGGITRIVLAVIGGVMFAQFIATYFRIGFRRNNFNPRGYGYEVYDGLYLDPKMIILTVIGTMLVWMFLLAITRR